MDGTHRSLDAIEANSQKRTSLVPIRVEFETDTQRIRDCFVWNLYETLIKPETFAKIFCVDLDLPIVWAETVANQIRAQLEEHEGVASLDLGVDDYAHVHADREGEGGEEIPECRVILSVSSHGTHSSLPRAHLSTCSIRLVSNVCTIHGLLTPFFF
jgi:chromatin structure-remodeling complex subunit SFH1